MELLDQYYSRLSNYSNSTKKVYIDNVKLYIEYIGNHPLRIYNTTKADIYNYVAYMDNLSKNTKKIRLNAVKNFYSNVDKKLAVFLFDDIKLYNTGKKVPYCLSLQQCNRLVNYYSDKRNKLIIYLFLTTGIRLSELANLRIENIDLIDHTLSCICKGNKTRVIYLNNSAIKKIQDYTNKKEGLLFELSRSAIQYIVKKALKDLGYKGSTHTLRHSAASLMYQNTKDI